MRVDEGDGFVLRSVEDIFIGYEFSSHQLCRDISNGGEAPVDPTNVFFSDDERAITWAKLLNVAEGVDVRWDFFEPNGSLYSTTTYDELEDLPPGWYYEWATFWGWIWLDGYSAAHKTGPWRVEVSINDPTGQFEHVYTDYFQVREAEPTSPDIAVSASPAQPLEGEEVTLHVLAHDQGYLGNVSVSWTVGSEEEEWTVTDVNANDLDQEISVGSFPEEVWISYWASAVDNDGNSAETEVKSLHIADTDVDGPAISDVSIGVDSGQLCASWVATDPSGVAGCRFLLEEIEAEVSGSYEACMDAPENGSYLYRIYATDGDVPPATSVFSDTVQVEVVATELVEFTLSGGVGCADMCWVMNPTAPYLDYRVVGSRENSEWDVPRSTQHGAAQCAHDESAAVAAGGLIEYALLGELRASSDWRTLRTESVFVEPLPISTGLNGAYPNPFNPSVAVSYGVAKSERVKLAVFDIAGRLIRVLEDGVRESGRHTVTWSGVDRAGKPVASGVYVIRLQAGKDISCAKVVLMQ